MIVNYYKMSGEELKKIYDVSDMNGDQFAGRLGISRAKLYTQFKQAIVDSEVEMVVLKDPELAKNRQLFSINSKDEDDDGSKSFRPSMELWEKTLEMLNETVKLLADDNRFIKKDAEIFRDIVEAGVKSGQITFGKLATKGR